jgi:hypothetical protein
LPLLQVLSVCSHSDCFCNQGIDVACCGDSGIDVGKKDKLEAKMPEQIVTLEVIKIVMAPPIMIVLLGVQNALLEEDCIKE